MRRGAGLNSLVRSEPAAEQFHQFTRRDRPLGQAGRVADARQRNGLLVRVRREAKERVRGAVDARIELRAEFRKRTDLRGRHRSVGEIQDMYGGIGADGDCPVIEISELAAGLAAGNVSGL